MAVLVVLILTDALVGYRLWESGWPKHVILSSGPSGVEHVRVTQIPFTGTDWIILAVVIAIHAFLGYLVWKAWRSSPIQV